MPLPSFMLLDTPVEPLSHRLAVGILFSMFKKLHPGASGWDISLVNIAVTHMNVETSAGHRGSRSIAQMFEAQRDGLDGCKLVDLDAISPPSISEDGSESYNFNASMNESSVPSLGNESLQNSCEISGSEDVISLTQQSDMDSVRCSETDGNDQSLGVYCEICGAIMPPFAIEAHYRFHAEVGV